MFKQAKFLLSAAAKEQFPTLLMRSGEPMPEIALVGKSNVGKSSLLNHLVQHKKLAHTSSKPGKTRLVNFFTLDESLGLVDLPGYGFAKVAKNVRSQWGELTESYLKHREPLQLILHLIDARHPPTREDLSFVSWASHFGKPFLTIFTKSDKVRQTHLARECRKHFDLLCASAQAAPSTYLQYSIKDPRARAHLMREVEKRIRWD